MDRTSEKTRYDEVFRYVSLLMKTSKVECSFFASFHIICSYWTREASDKKKEGKGSQRELLSRGHYFPVFAFSLCFIFRFSPKGENGFSSSGGIYAESANYFGDHFNGARRLSPAPAFIVWDFLNLFSSPSFVIPSLVAVAWKGNVEFLRTRLFRHRVG